MRRDEKKNDILHSGKPVFTAFLVALAFIVVAALLWYPPVWQTLPVREADAVFLHTSEVGTLNVNVAMPEELAALPGIGPVKAQAIVDYRTAHGAFKSGEDLLQVYGIGEKTLADLLPFVVFDE